MEKCGTTSKGKEEEEEEEEEGGEEEEEEACGRGEQEAGKAPYIFR